MQRKEGRSQVPPFPFGSWSLCPLKVEIDSFQRKNIPSLPAGMHISRRCVCIYIYLSYIIYLCVCQLLCSKDFASANFLRFRYFATIQHAINRQQNLHNGNPQRRRRRHQKRMMISEKHVLPVAVCLSASRISKKLDQFWRMSTHSPCMHVM